MLDTMHCLQVALVPDAMGKGVTTCDMLSHKAFGTHADCYVQNGLCSIPQDWGVITSIIQFKDLFENWDAFLSELKAVGECLYLLLTLIT